MASSRKRGDETVTKWGAVRRRLTRAWSSALLSGAITLTLFVEPAYAQDEAALADDSAGGSAVLSDEPDTETEDGASALAEDPEVETDAEVEADAADDVIVETGGSLFESATASFAADDDGGGGSATYALNGHIRGDVFIGKVPDRQQSEIKAGYGELALKLRATGGAYGDAYADFRFRYGAQDASRQLFIDAREAYVNAYLGPLDLRLGQQIIVWGRADGFNPTNNLNAVDWRIRSPNEDDKRIGNLAARAFLNFRPLRLEMVWQPFYQAIEFPPIDLPPLVGFGDEVFPPHKLVHSTGAARLHLELPAIELSASYLYGYAPMPGLTFRGVMPDSEAPVRISRVAYRHQVIGFDFSTALGDFMAVRGEAAYRRPETYQTRHYVPNPDLQYILGLEKAFGSVSVIAQYMGRYVFDWAREPGAALGGLDPSQLQNISEEVISLNVNRELARRNQGLFQQLAQVQHLVSGRIEWLTAHDTLSLSAFGMLNLTTEEWLVFPRILYKISDGLSTTLGAEIYSGPEGTLLDLVENSLTAGYVELKYSF